MSNTDHILKGRELVRDHMLVTAGPGLLFVLVTWTADEVSVSLPTLHGESETLVRYDADLWIPNNGNLWFKANVEKRIAERGTAGLRVTNGRLATR